MLDNDKWEMHTSARARKQKYISIYISLHMKTFLKTGVNIYIHPFFVVNFFLPLFWNMVMLVMTWNKGKTKITWYIHIVRSPASFKRCINSVNLTLGICQTRLRDNFHICRLQSNGSLKWRKCSIISFKERETRFKDRENANRWTIYGILI